MSGALQAVAMFKAAAASGPTLIASDNFDSYTSAVDLADQSGWASVNGSPVIYKPGGDGSTYSSNTQQMARSTATFSANQRSVCTCELLTPGSFSFVCIGVRCQAGLDTRYWFQTDGTNWYLVARNSGSQTVLTSGTHSITSGAKIALEATGAGSATRLTAQVNTGGGWTNVTGIVSYDPSGATYIDGGTPGIGADGAANTQARGDDWEGWNL